MSKRKQSTLDSWCSSSSKNPAREPAIDHPVGETESYSDRDEDREDSGNSETSPKFHKSSVSCIDVCCSNDLEPYQPKNTTLLKGLAKGGRSFLAAWFSLFPWLTVCVARGSVFCLYCRYCTKHGLISFSKNSSPAFVDHGFNNWKKGPEKFKIHESSLTHREAVMKWKSLGRPSLLEQFSAETVRLQHIRRSGLLKQLSALKFLLQQGLAVRGHKDIQGNLFQLLRVWASDNPDINVWLENKKYMSADIVNELITIMGQSVLRTLLGSIRQASPAWFSVLADEATDVVNREQFNVSIRWVNDEYIVSEEPIGLFCLPDTTASTLTSVLKDILIRCSLPLGLCRGQAYDGAANMQGKRKGLSTMILKENPAAVPVHCFAHCMNLCLQEVGRQISPLRNALDVVRETSRLIAFSPKRSHLFSTKLIESPSAVSIKPFCPTRWTARTTAIEAVLKDYAILIHVMEEINLTTHDDNGLKAHGVLVALEKFETLFWLKFGHLVFGAAEEVSKCLQAKDTSLQEAMSAVNLASAFYKRQRSELSFNYLYDQVVKTARQVGIGSPALPRFRRKHSRVDGGSHPHQFSSPRDYYRHLYFQTCDLLLNELQDRFEGNCNLAPVMALESLLVKAANGEDSNTEIESLQDSCFADDLDFTALRRHLPFLVDGVKQSDPRIRKVTTVQTVCSAMNSNKTYKQMLPEVQKLLRLYLTVPVTTSTSERSFSALKRLLTYLRATMTEKRLIIACFYTYIKKLQTISISFKYHEISLMPTTNARNISVVFLTELCIYLKLFNVYLLADYLCQY